MRIKKNSVQLPNDELINSELAKIEEKDYIGVERFLKRQYRENENFEEKMKLQINLWFDQIVNGDIYCFLNHLKIPSLFHLKKNMNAAS